MPGLLSLFVNSSFQHLSEFWRHIQWGVQSHLDNGVKVRPPVHKEKHHMQVREHAEDRSVLAAVMREVAALMPQKLSALCSPSAMDSI